MAQLNFCCKKKTFFNHFKAVETNIQVKIQNENCLPDSSNDHSARYFVLLISVDEKRTTNINDIDDAYALAIVVHALQLAEHPSNQRSSFA